MLIRQFLSVRGVAELLNVGDSTVRHWVKDGSLRAINVGREWRIRPKDIESFLQAHANQPPDEPDLPRDNSAGGAISPPEKPR